MPILIRYTDGGVGVMRLTKDADPKACVSEFNNAHPGLYASHREVTEAEIPTDRTFRNAWTDEGSLTVDMKKAREIHRAALRSSRSPKLAALDVEYQRADEVGDARAKALIVQRKNELRAVTDIPEIEAADTPEALKAVWPVCLKD